ncbi:hypothetical protein BS47DRAFT_1353566 [Hydnum rufescens UP504]|uniref:Uncharacterized protein n=1 Tax=Hydnum rufescens UP504 TaxID=1448309 RepID=A0A9P6AHJ9_9AGAM|nr:hypothetical protein BS47DRAFT_1353566 [Hydnum rufescens UP504]
MDYYLLPDAFAFTLSGSPTPLDLEWATPNETYNSSNFAAEPSLLHEVLSLPAATVPTVTDEPPAYDQWDGLMYPFEPDLMYLAPALGTMQVPQDTTYTPDSDIPEGGDGVSETSSLIPNFADFGTVPGPSGHVTSSVATTLASVSTSKINRCTSPRTRLKGRHPDLSARPRPSEVSSLDRHPQETNLGAPDQKLQDEEFEIGCAIADRVLDEARQCGGQGVPQADRLECGSCYRKRIDGGWKDDWAYVRPELNALVRTAISEARVSASIRKAISSNIAHIPKALEDVRPTLLAHMTTVRSRPRGDVAMRDGSPRPWKVTRANGLVVVREDEE